jgi:hypothetical protein
MTDMNEVIPLQFHDSYDQAAWHGVELRAVWDSMRAITRIDHPLAVSGSLFHRRVGFDEVFHS